MMFYLFNCHICRPEKSRGQKQWSTFCQTIKIQKKFQCQGIKVSQRMLDLQWKDDTNLSCKCKVSSRPWKPWKESRRPLKPCISYIWLMTLQKCLSLTFMETHEVRPSVKWIELIIKYPKILKQKILSYV